MAEALIEKAGLTARLEPSRAKKYLVHLRNVPSAKRAADSQGRAGGTHFVAQREPAL